MHQNNKINLHQNTKQSKTLESVAEATKHPKPQILCNDYNSKQGGKKTQSRESLGEKHTSKTQTTQTLKRVDDESKPPKP